MAFWLCYILLLAVLLVLAWCKPGLALICLLLVILGTLGLFIYRGSVEGSSLCAFGAVAVLLTALISRRQPDTEGPGPYAARCLLLGAAWVYVALVVVGSVFSPLGLVFVVALVGLILQYMLATRRSVAAGVLSTISAAMRQDLPLYDALRAASDGRTDKVAWALRRIAACLAQGASLTTAIRQGYPACPGHALGAIEAAERVGRLPAALAAVEADVARDIERKRELRPFFPVYPVVLLIVVVGMCTGIVMFVLPKLEMMLWDFGLDLPASTRRLVTALEGLAKAGPLIALAILVGVPLGIYAAFRPRRPDRPRALSVVGDFLRWRLPILHWFERNRSLLRTVEMLRLCLAAGCTLDRAVANTLAVDVNETYRARLARWHQAVVAGRDVAAAARNARVGEPLAWAFDRSVNPGNAPAVLEMLETNLRAAYDYRGTLARYIIWPCLVLALAALIGAVVYAILAPIFAVLYPAHLLMVP